MTNSRRILICGHHPSAPSGFARISRGIGAALKARGHTVAFVDMLGRGGPAQSGPVYSIPGSYPTRGKAAFEEALSTFRPDMLLTAADTWDQYYIPELLGDVALPWVCYVPVEQAPARSVLNVFVVPELAGRPFDARALLLRATRVVAYNGFGKTQLQAMLPERCVDDIVLAVDTALFHCVSEPPSREAVFGPGAGLSEDTFLVTTVARNLERKALDLLLMAWSRFVARLDPSQRHTARLYLHVPREDGGHNLEAILKLLECSATVLSDHSLTVDQGIDEQRLVQIMQTSSVYLNTSRAEGFGLPIVEAMAAGVPSIVPDTAGPGCIAALVNDPVVVRAVPIVQQRVNAVDSTWWSEVDVEQVAECLAKEHRWWRATSPDARRERSRQIAGAAQKHFSWDKIGAEWIAYLERVLVNAVRVEPPAQRPSARVEKVTSSAAPAVPTLSVIIPAYNNAEEVLRCVESLRATATFAHQYIVQDDCSPNVDLRERVPLELAETYRNERNEGFAGNTHAAVAHATGDILFFVNQDVFADAVAARGWDERLFEALADPTVGAVGALLFFPLDPLAHPDQRRVQSCGGDFDELGQPSHPLLGADVREHPGAREACDAAWVTGAALATRREHWFHTGGFDRAYTRGYFEDVDFCLKLRQAGLRIRYEPKIELYHSAGTTGGAPTEVFAHNRRLFVSRWLSSGILEALSPVQKLDGRARVSGTPLALQDTTPSSIERLRSGNYFTYFFLPDGQQPSGGIGLAYDHVRVMNEHGFRAAVVHTRSGFWPEWLGERANGVPILYTDEGAPGLRREDVVLIPEISVWLMDRLRSVDCKRVVFCQNWFFVLNALGRGVFWDSFGIRDCISVSGIEAAYLARIMPFLNIKTVVGSLDDTLFTPPADLRRKGLVVCYKGSRDGQKGENVIKTFLALHPQLRHVTFRELVGLSTQDYASALREAAFYLHMDEYSSWGTAPIEAFLSGCLVAGWDGVGGKEYLNDQNAWLAPNGDMFGLAVALGRLIETWLQGAIPPETWPAMKQATQIYTKQAEKDSIVRVHTELRNERLQELEGAVRKP